MTLLKKKDDSKNMGNYCKLSLANCDYKCFTKILNQRMMVVSPKLINSNQIGFIPGKYIVENCLYNIMVNNQIKINTNGHLTDPVAKLRGFKQSDPISCLCYDFAFEPFLQSILQDQDFSGYELQNILPLQRFLRKYYAMPMMLSFLYMTNKIFVC
ncbi:hypothetical protein MAM1_0038d02775 [Mucor ambiguus]|uniref:Reverse transcriptase domain-containing protein n=1 Tax=Mucor ambiguus TaxID=91626 RepID=A0A0C9MJK6_9FUNG|nr:hypothetical protein MAM1_0038d02775 [Mucor ambiguus]